MVKIPVVAIIGRPNVGKSTLFNRLAGGRFAIESETEGTTRDRLYRRVAWNQRQFLLVDTAGLLAPGKTEMKLLVHSQIEAALAEADLVLLVLDGTVGLTKEDHEVVRLLRKQSKQVVVAVNKLDRRPREEEIAELNKIGLGELFAVSALHGRGTGDLLDGVVAKLPETKLAGEPESELRISIIGRPNVGKSSLLNSITKKQRAVVSSTPGTTRDYVEETVTFHGEKFCFIDTAGIRRRGKVERGIEKYSVLRSLRSIENSDIVLLLLDATDPALAQDLHIAGSAKDAGKAIILVVNKWDLVEKDDRTMDRELAKLRKNFDFISWAPVIFISAETGQNVAKILELIHLTAEKLDMRIPTPQLNNFFQDLSIEKPVPGRGRYRPKLFYATQTGNRPPSFTIFAKHADKIHFSWIRFAENRMRQKWGFGGTPIRIHLRERRSQ